MEVTKLSKDKSEILVQLYDSLEDVLEKGNELDKRILKQINTFNEIESELLKLEEKFDDLKESNSGNLTMTGARDAGDIVKEIILKKQEKDSVLENDKNLYNEYIIITDEIKNIQDNINYILNEEEIETLTENSGFFVESLGKVHIKSTDMKNIEINSVSENSKISISSFSNMLEISRIYSNNEEEHTEIENAHDKLVNIYNIRNRQKEEQEALLNLIPKFIEPNETKKEEVYNDISNEDNAIEENNVIVDNSGLNENQDDNSNDINNSMQNEDDPINDNNVSNDSSISDENQMNNSNGIITINNNLPEENVVSEEDSNIIQNEEENQDDNLNNIININNNLPEENVVSEEDNNIIQNEEENQDDNLNNIININNNLPEENVVSEEDNNIIQNEEENQDDNLSNIININNNLPEENVASEEDNNIIQKPIEANVQADNLNEVINAVDSNANDSANQDDKTFDLNNNVEINLPVSNPLNNNVPLGNEIPTLTVPDPVMNSSVDSVLSPTYETNDKQNVPLSEEEVNNILSGGKTDSIVPLDSILNTNQSVNNAPSIEKNTQENVDTILIEKPLKLVKIANSSKEKVQTILNVWSKRPIEKTIIKNVTSNKDEINNVQSVPTPGNDVQQFFLGQAS